MSAFSGNLSISAVFGYSYVRPMLSNQTRINDAVTRNGSSTCNFEPKWIAKEKMQFFRVERDRPCFALSRGGNYGLKFDDEDQEDPYWLRLCKDSIRGLKVLFAFLIQQPGQLKYIEWPSFNDTLRTATLTLVLVVMLIVALSSVDSALSFILALLLRRPA